ncbi:MAG: arylsulfatase [Holophagales bacterium]|nr:arylsulfatase [Holophagales bacterium]MYG29048.1 arylsulfatase [Holophagales bacterium]MYI80632.1 arylsulfatase [Holophagales bacterium]
MPAGGIALAVALTTTGLTVLGCGGTDSAPRPDIVLIMADDMGFSDLGSYGSEIDTPNLDRLASHGLRFSHFYNTARCCPTRASLLTGLYAHQAGVGHMMGDDGLPGYRGDLAANAITVAEALRAAGYGTYMSGKWHVTRHVGHWSGNDELTSTHNWPRQRGFDRFYGTIHGAGSFYDPISLTEDNEPVELTPPDDPEAPVYYYTDAISEHAVRFVREHAAGDRSGDPLFLYVAHTAPHWPLHALPDDIARYRGRYAAGWDAIRTERRRRLIELGLIDADWPIAERDPRVPAWEDVPDQERPWFERAMEVYAAQVDSMDRGIGEVVAALEKTGRLDNTLILFLADNGGCAEVLTDRWTGLAIPKQALDGSPVAVGNDTSVLPGPESSYQSYGPHWAHASNTPFRLYKHWVHEGGIASPLIVHWPARIADGGGIVREVAHVIDLMATALDAAGAPHPSSRAGDDSIPVEGTSLLPAFQDQPLEREAVFWEHEGNRAVRSGKWKLVSRYPGEWELYDLVTDRTEAHDLAADEPGQVAALAALWNDWAARTGVVPWDEIRERRQAARVLRSGP